jgi:propionyl-CoA carboxylase alpha chain
MRHPRWREGRISTAFIAEEYPDGFAPIVPDDDEKAVLAAVATAVELLRRDRLDRLSGRLAPHSGALKPDWVVRLGNEYLNVALGEGMVSIPLEMDISVEEGAPLTVASDWRPGESVWRGTVGGRQVAAQIRPVENGVRIAWKGMAGTARVMRPRTAELDRLMPAKIAPDTSKLLLCPMPGLVVSILVAEAQEVKAGEMLAVVEAMKMENVLRAERDLTVAKINARPGDSLAVDAVIMEFS